MKPTLRLISGHAALFSSLLLPGSVHPLAAQTIYTPYHFVTIAGTPGARGSADGVGAAARFYDPEGVAVDGSGNVYVTDSSNYTVRKITPTVAGGVTTWTVTTLAGTAGVVGAQDGTGAAAQFRDPTLIQIGANGDAYVFDVAGGIPYSGVYRQITPQGVVTSPGSAATGEAVMAGYDAVVDAFGNAYYTAQDYIVKYSNGALQTFAGTAGGAGSADGSGAQATFYTAIGAVSVLGVPNLALDASGNVYLADTYNSEIRKLTPSAYTTTLGGVAGVTGSSDGTGSAALFSVPFGVAVDAKGNVYVADTGNDTIRMGYALVAPSFTLAASPAATTVASGRSAVFNAIATGSPAPTYQWTLNGSTTIPGASVTTDPILVITGATASDVGTLTCTASNGVGAAATTSATLAVVTTGSPGYLTNLSARGVVGSGAANALFGGFGVAGTGTKNLLIRGMGPGIPSVSPSLAGLVLTDTQLTYYSNPVQQNSGWGGVQAIADAETLVGAYPVPANSLDSMILAQAGIGSATASVAGVGNATGIATVELYDADTAPTSRLVNVSARAPVGTGGNILFGGFTVGGSTAETLLIRAIGPSLTIPSPGLTGLLAQPTVTIYSGGTPLYTNTVWGGDQALVNAQATVGAFALPASSADSLLLVTLAPGGYTAEVSGVNFTTGIAGVEVYEVY